MKKIQRIFCVTIFVFALLLHGGNDRAWGAPVCLEQARRVVENWLTFTPCPLDTPMGCRIDEIIHYKGGPYGDAGYYVAFLEPCGWVAVPADDWFEAVMAFGSDAVAPDDWIKTAIASILHVNSSKGMTSVVMGSALPSNSRSMGRPYVSSMKKRWNTLLQDRESVVLQEPQGRTISATSADVLVGEAVRDRVIVAPLLGKTTWGQSHLYRDPADSSDQGVCFYNYFTYVDGISYSVGCGALATAMIMSHFKYPVVAPLMEDSTHRYAEV